MKEKDSIATNLSRREFLESSGLATLALTAGGLGSISSSASAEAKLFLAARVE